MNKTLVIGLGNPILSDDGVGVWVAHAVQQALAVNPHDGVTVTEASVGGLRLMEMMVGYERVLLVDALTWAEEEAGAVRRLTLQELTDMSPTQHSASAHDTNLITALRTGQLLGLPLPQELVIYGITVENVSDFGDRLTPAVAEAVPKATKAVLHELGR